MNYIPVPVAGRWKLTKPTALALVFVFLASPFFQVEAQRASAQTSDAGAVLETTNTISEVADTLPSSEPIEKPVLGIDVPEVLPTEPEPAPEMPVLPDEPLMPWEGEPMTDTESAQMMADMDPQALQVSDDGSSRLPDPSEGLTTKLRSDVTTGALSYEYEIALPPGRLDMTPELSLTYSSNDRNSNSYVGYGWSLSLPSISRQNRHGSERLYDVDDFVSSVSGELASTTGTYWAPVVENGEFTSYSYASGYWTAWDKEGTQYIYGRTAASRQDDPSEQSRVFKWMLEEVRDTHGNTITYEYAKHYGQIYPERITYTNNGTKKGIFEVRFARENVDVGARSFATGFEVTTRQRITKIEIAENGTIVRSYALAYADADATSRAMLASITESGYDPTTKITVSKRPEKFTYQKRGPISWPHATDWTLPHYFYDAGAKSASMAQMRDINGDAYPDYVYQQNGDHHVYINKGNGQWDAVPDNQWMLPRDTTVSRRSYTYQDNGVRMFDYNGDAITDFLWGKASSSGVHDNFEQGVYMNSLDPAQPWIQQSTRLPIAFIFGDRSNADNSNTVVDVNGDGLPDIVYAHIDDDNDASDYFLIEEAFLNTGGAWTKAQEGQWSVPWGVVDENPQGEEIYTYADFVDLNDDGLNDFVFKFEDNDYDHNIPEKTALNDSTTWLPLEQHGWRLPYHTEDDDHLGTDEDSSDAGTRFFDVNGDGVEDQVVSYENSGRIGAAVAFGTLREGAGGFTNLESITMPQAFARKPQISTHVVLSDVNADGMMDILYAVEPDDEPLDAKVYLNAGTPFTDLLTQVETPEGASATITYKQSSKYKDSNGTLLNPKLPITVTTVESIKITQPSAIPISPTLSTTYQYEGGSYWYKNAYDRKFSGFEKVTVTDGDGYKTSTYYHQGNDTRADIGEYDDHIAKAGKPYRVEEYDQFGKLWRLSLTTWDRSALSDNRSYVKPVRNIVITYDDNGYPMSKAEEYSYDPGTGNLLQKVHYGDVNAGPDGGFSDLGGRDRFTETFAYARNTGKYIYGLPASHMVADYTGNKVAETRYYYDARPLGEVLKGSVTMVERWIASTTYETTRKTYNGYGLPTRETDPRGKETVYTYDSAILYPATVTGPTGLITKYAYDYSSGKARSKTDPNGAVYATMYDGFDRVRDMRQPDPVTGSTVIRTQFIYSDDVTPRKVSRFDYLSAGISRVTHSFFDGLDRLIQERREIEAGYAVKNYLYDHRGLLDSESPAYANASSAFTPPNTDWSIYTQYVYDPLKRPRATITPTGSIVTWQEDWYTRQTDQLNKQKVFYRDAYDNLSRVDEYIGSTIYTTQYEWDFFKRLRKITDALGNVRSFSYDGVGNRLYVEDLHAPSDTTFGTWRYTYDAAGNMVETTNPNGQVIRHTYDDLNRVATEDFAAMPGIEITYTYDSCTNGKGRLCKVDMSSGVDSTYTYDPAGNTATETRTIDTTMYTTTTAYDRQGTPTVITYPDGGAVTYGFNAAGLLKQISFKTPSNVTIPIITNLTYSPVDSITNATFGNGVKLVNTYDPKRNYWLTGKALSMGSAKLQSISYAYDRVGNITRLVEAAPTAAQRSVSYLYDDLHRLASATATSTNPAGNYSHGFGYSAIGNIIKQSAIFGQYVYSDSKSGSYANPHAPVWIASEKLSYDRNGNLKEVGTVEMPTFMYQWNYRDELVAADTFAAGLSATYAYDHTGERVKAVVNGVTTHYPNDLYNVTAGKRTAQVFANDLLVATLETVGATTTPYFVHTGHLGGTNVVTNAAGAAAQVLDYYPYGKERVASSTGGFDEQRTFIGEISDDATGLSYLNARYYNPRSSLFTSQDPAFRALGEPSFGDRYGRSLQMHLLDPQLLNSYNYARLNPVRYSDPSGEILPAVAIGALLWATAEGALTAYDGYNLYKTATDPNATAQEKQIASAGFGAGLALPGGGYGSAGKKATEIAQNALRAGRLSDSAISISQDRLAHVLQRHTSNGARSSGASIFKDGVDISSLIREASSARSVKQAGGNFQRVYDAKRIIGFDTVTGRNTSVVTVITNKRGDLVTAFPGKPRPLKRK